MPLTLFKERAPDRPKKVIAIAAGKGGVGKSTVTAQLAIELNLLGLKVGILDADLYGPSIRKMLPETDFPKKLEGKFIPASSRGISIMTLAYFQDEGVAASIRAPIATQFIKQFVSQVEWGALDFLLIDFPPGTGDIQLTLSQIAAIDVALIVTTPQEVAIQDVKRAISLFQKVSIPIVGVIENMSYLISDPSILPFGSGGGEKLAKEYGVPLLKKIPLDPSISIEGDSGYIQPKMHLAKEFLKFLNLMQKNSGALSSFELVW